MSCLSRTPSPEDEAMYHYTQAPPLPGNPVPPTRATPQRQRLPLSRQDAYNFNAPPAHATSNAAHSHAQPTHLGPSSAMLMRPSHLLSGPQAAAHVVNTGPVPTSTSRPRMEPTFDDPRVTIDHSAYPHIFESIYEQTPPPRLHFRLLHRFLKDKVDDENVRHVGLVDGSNAKGLGIAKPRGRIVSAFRAGHVLKSTHGQTPFWFYVNLGKASPTLHRIPSLSNTPASFRNVEVLDLVGFPPTGIPTELKTLRIPTVRLIPTAIDPRLVEDGLKLVSSSIQAETIVLFSRTRRWPDEYRPVLPLSFQAHRLVVYVGPPVDHGMVTGAYLQRRNSSLVELHRNVMVFCDFHSPPEYDHPVVLFEERTLIFDPQWTRWKPQCIPNSSGGILSKVLDKTATRMRDMGDRPTPPRLILVGLELLPSSAIHGPINDPFGHGPDYLCDFFPQFPADQDDCTDMRRRLCASLAFELMKLWNNRVFQPSADGVQERKAADMVNAWMSFRTCEEHQAIVGPKQWRIQTVGYLWHMVDEPDYN